MRKIFLLLILFFLLGSRNFCYGLDWQRLHEQADRVSLSGSLALLKNNPGSIDDLYVLGLVYLNLHKDKQAESVFRKIMRLEPKTEAAKWGLAEVIRREHGLKEAEALIREVLKSNPQFYPAYISLAYIKYTQNDFKTAISLAGQVARQARDKADTSNFARAYLIIAGSKGMLAYNGGLISKVANGLTVMGYIRKAEKLRPDSAEVYLGLGSYYLLAPAFAGGNIDKAKGYFEKAVKADPLFADAYARLAQVYKIKGDREKFASFIVEALKIDPRNELATDILAKELEKSIKVEDILGVFP